MWTRRTAGMGFVLFVVLAGVIGVACGGGGARSSHEASSTRLAAPAEGGSALDVSGRAVTEQAAPPGLGQADQGVPELQTKVIKAGQLTVVVRDGSVDRLLQETTLVAGRYGGFVSSSRSSGGEHPSGTVVIRVPAAQFEIALGELKALGTVKSEQVSGQDVTAQFIDLEARLRNWEAQETVLLRLMAKSTSIEESLKVQRTLQEVQLAIEEIRGQLRVLGDQTDFSTISVSLVESGATAGPGHENAFVRAWRQARRGFVAVFAAAVVGLGYLAPFVLIGLALMAGWTVHRRGRAKPAATA